MFRVIHVTWLEAMVTDLKSHLFANWLISSQNKVCGTFRKEDFIKHILQLYWRLSSLISLPLLNSLSNIWGKRTKAVKTSSKFLKFQKNTLILQKITYSHFKTKHSGKKKSPFGITFCPFRNTEEQIRCNIVRMKGFTKNATFIKVLLRQILYSSAQKHYSAHAGKSANPMYSGILAPMEGILFYFI